MAFETRLTPGMAARWRGAGLWGDETFASVLARRVRETPDRACLPGQLFQFHLFLGEKARFHCALCQISFNFQQVF
jgi:non-ribosomal peptide synthetase component E (peptide arylation enzyme)